MFRSWFHLYVTVLQNKTVAYLGGGWVGNQGGGGCRLELAWLSKLRCRVPVFLFCWVFLGLGGSCNNYAVAPRQKCNLAYRTPPR